ncbi:MAG: ABC transporter ATP-binding protein/permease [Lachnospiraceae bacterium]|nr:ABC transporter ATP-binding protein/permease [Lachnospiraceae bacterium]
MNAKITYKTAIRFVLKLFSYAKLLTFLMFFMVLGNTIFMYVVPICTEKIVDGLLAAKQPTISYGIVIAYAVILLISVLSANVERFIAIKHSEVIGDRFRKDFFQIMFEKNYVEFNRNSYGDMETVMTACVEDINDAAYCFIETLIVYPIGIILGTVYISSISLWLILILLIQLFLNYMIMHRGSMLQNKVQKENYQARSRYFSVLSALYHAYENVRLLFLVSNSQKKHDRASNEFAQANVKMAKVNAIHISMLLELSDAILSIAVIIMFYFLIRNGEGSIGSYIAFVAMKEAISGSFNGFIRLKANKATFDAALEQIDTIESLEDFMKHENAPEKDLINSVSSINLAHITYTYPDSKQHFLFDIEFKKNNCYLIVGENGVGKSTFIRLLTKMLTGDKNINTDGIVIKVLPQNIQLFDESIIDILIDSKSHFSEEVASQLGVLELINEMKQNQDTEESVISSLSGGEKKKILFSFIMGQSFDVLILDEPFAEIDMGSKAALANIISNSYNESIVIVITHEIPDVLKENATMIRLEKQDGVSRFVRSHD